MRRARKKKEEGSQYIIGLARNIMGQLELTPEDILLSWGYPWGSHTHADAVYEKVRGMSPEKWAQIASFGLPKGEVDRTCTPYRFTSYWHIDLHGPFWMRPERMSGGELQFKLAGDTIMAAMWDWSVYSYSLMLAARGT